VLQERYRHEPAYYIEENEQGDILAAVPFFHISSPLTGKRLACLPCSEYCWPLGESSDSVFRILDFAKREVSGKQGWYLEIRGRSGTLSPGELGLNESLSRLRHVADISDGPAKVRARIEAKSQNLKRSLKRSEASNLTVREARTTEDLRGFYELTSVTRKRLNLLPWTYRFIESMYRIIVLTNHGFLLLVELGNEVIAGSMFFMFKDQVLLKINASSNEHSQYRPNYLLTWAAIERACKSGCKYFDFGITDMDNEGLLSFKRQWATDELPAPYFYYPAIKGANTLSRDSWLKQAYMLFNQRAPGLALSLAAGMLNRHLG
jgi:hypothetical protein